jgi:hypothetical protein
VFESAPAGPGAIPANNAAKTTTNSALVLI